MNFFAMKTALNHFPIAYQLSPLGSRFKSRTALGAVKPREHLHKSIPVIASAAKQSIFACQSSTYGSPRRYAPRDDGLMQTFPKDRGPARRALEPDALIGQASQLLDARPHSGTRRASVRLERAALPAQTLRQPLQAV